MPILIQAQNLSLSYSARPLFRDINFSISSGEKIGLIGPNGAGKSSLMKILAGLIKPDSGQLSKQKGLRVGYLEQVPQFRTNASIQDTILEGAQDPHDWEEIHRCQVLMSQMGLDQYPLSAETPVDSLSGGWRKRVALARELQKQPDLLLLDEPTNHLDVEGILEWEEIIASAPFAVLTITHDRYFLDRVSTRILELDRKHKQGLLSVNGDYSTYLTVREQLLEAQSAQELKLKNTLRRETEWLRRGAKARTTKQVARINRAEDLKNEVSDISDRNRNLIIKMELQGAEKNPKKLIEAQGISKSYQGQAIVPPIDLLITPGTRLGLLGVNGCGKSTLIKLLLGTLESDTGTIKHSEHLKVSYFEQNRDSLDPNDTVFRAVCPAGEYVHVAGRPIHAKGYLDRFLFGPEQHSMPVRSLSGGEQSRLLLARLFLTEANVLVLDEPTNDLDMATLNILEDVLQEYDGAVILVTHDRYFMDRVATKLLAFEKSEQTPKLVPFASLQQWEEYWQASKSTKGTRAQEKQKQQKNSSEQTQSSANSQPLKKLSFKEQKELQAMEQSILEAEALTERLQAESADPAIATNSSKLTEVMNALGKAQAEVERLYARWTELSSRQGLS